MRSKLAEAHAAVAAGDVKEACNASNLICRYFSGRPAPGLPALARADNSVRPNFEERLLSGSAVQQQYYQQYVRPATQRSFKQMQVRQATRLTIRGSVSCMLVIKISLSVFRLADVTTYGPCMQRAAIKKQLFLRDFDVKQPEDVSSFARISVTLATDLAVPLLASNRSVQVELEFNSTAALAFLGNSVRTESATYLTRVRLARRRCCDILSCFAMWLAPRRPLHIGSTARAYTG